MEKQIILMMGTPASGKSFIAKKLFSDWKILDCDSIKESNKNYDPENPSTLHEWSANELQKQINESFEKRENFIIDGTGSNSEKMIRYINKAVSLNYKTTLVYIIASLKTCLRRNRERPRHVSDDVIVEKFNEINTSFNIVAPMVDEVKVINND